MSEINQVRTFWINCDPAYAMNCLLLLISTSSMLFSTEREAKEFLPGAKQKKIRITIEELE